MKAGLVNIFKNILSRAMIVIVTLIVFLLIAEVATRLFSKIETPLKIRDIEIGQTYRPNFSGKRYISESEQYVKLRFTKDGFRGENREFEKSPNTARIVVLGDSQIAAIATQEEDTMVAQLEKLLNKNHPSIDWEVFNFGISGASTGQELVLFRKLASKYEPDIVICAYYVGNDFSDNCDWLDSNPRIYMDIDKNGELYVKPYSVTRKKLSIWLNLHSRFYVWQKYRFRVLTKTVERSDAIYEVRGGDLIYKKEDSEPLNEAWNLNKRIIHAFHEEVMDKGSHFLFVVLPSPVQLYKDNWEEFIVKDEEARPYLSVDYPDQKLAEIVNQKSIDHLFLREGLEEYIDGRLHTDTEARVLYGGDAHLDETGNRLSAELIYTHLLSNRIITQIIP